MSCCTADLATDVAALSGDPDRTRRTEELRHAGRALDDGGAEFVLQVPDVHCGLCIAAIEDRLSRLPGVESARVNLTLKRVSVSAALRLADDPFPILEALDGLGYPATPVDLGDLDDLDRSRRSGELLRALAVAGFASANVMLLSVSVWSGAGEATRDLFHLVSALIAVPAVAYSSRIFFVSALGALRAGRMNMDVPIALAILLAVALSIAETFTGGSEAYFDAALTLTFFLLIGRFLDERMRERARSAVTALARLAAKGATVIENGAARYVPLDEIVPGMRLRCAAGERIAVDAAVLSATGSVDRSLVTGESAAVAVAAGDRLEAGTVNLAGPLDLQAVSSAKDSFLAEIQRMMLAAEEGHGRYTRIADRMARIYAPAVHIAAAATFLAWIVAGAGWYAATTTAIAVLIVTCPCALGLAVPVVHVVAAARLFENGILMKDGSGLERLASVTHAVFDKTGTLTSGEPRVTAARLEADDAPLALALARFSHHPAAKAVARHLDGIVPANIEAMTEHAGLGLEARSAGRILRLGRPDWVEAIAGPVGDDGGTGDASLAFALEGRPSSSFTLREGMRPGAATIGARLEGLGIGTEILSGDAAEPVARLAHAAGMPARARATPADKIARILQLQAEGARVLMVGDGLNDAPSLAAGDASMAPASGSDVGRLAADFVFTRDDLGSVGFTIALARRARTLVTQNFGLAIAYNCVAVPLAVAGFVTPMVAAIAMSASSILVVANSLRLNGANGGESASPSRAAGHRMSGRPTHAPLAAEHA